MSQPLEISHDIIKDYIFNEINSDDLNLLNKQKEKEASLKEILQVIDDLKKITGQVKEAKTKNIPDSFSDIDSVILQLQSGKLKPARAKAILNWIVQSPQFFEKFYTRLSQVTSLQVEGDLPELQDVAIKTDDMILEELGVLKKEKSANKFEELVDRIRGLFVEKPRLAYATISFLILSICSPFGIRFYNTSFQLMQAENLLQENYRIYMSETPRLSGGYASTGISMLMSDEDEKENYLDSASRKIKIADDYDSGLADAKQLQAQIFFIQKQYAKADSVLNLIDESQKNKAGILNDIGVIKFAQNDYENSISYFEYAIKSDPEFSEAYYNLALAKAKLGNKEESIDLLNQFLKMEQDEGWKNAALNLLDELK